MLELKNINKSYQIKKDTTKVDVLKEVNLTIEKGKFYAITGHSGSGKSTLINIIGLIDTQTSGTYLIDNIDTNNLSEDEKTKLRQKKFGFIFQSFYLNNTLTAVQNVIIPTFVNKEIKSKDRQTLAQNLLKKLNIDSSLYNHKPKELSGGEKQRVAIARALINSPDYIIADEPTGNLDKENEKIVFDILKKLVTQEHKTVIAVSHSSYIKNYADEIYTIKDGKLIRGDKSEHKR